MANDIIDPVKGPTDAELVATIRALPVEHQQQVWMLAQACKEKWWVDIKVFKQEPAMLTVAAKEWGQLQTIKAHVVMMVQAGLNRDGEGVANSLITIGALLGMVKG